MKFTPDRWLAYGTALGMAGLIAAVCFLKPGTTLWLPPCPFYKLTGLYCPGCGTTRMIYFLVHGHPWLAFRENALAMIMLPGVIYGLVLQVIKPSADIFSRISPRWITGLCLLVLVFTVARNLPFDPFCRLAPGGDRCGRIKEVLGPRSMHGSAVAAPMFNRGPVRAISVAMPKYHWRYKP